MVSEGEGPRLESAFESESAAGKCPPDSGGRDELLELAASRRREKEVVDVELARMLVVVMGFDGVAGYYGLPAAAVESIVPAVNITFVPGTPPWIPGVVNVRGEIESVLDLRAVLGYGESSIETTSDTGYGGEVATGSRPSATGSRPSGTGSRPSGTGSRPSGTGSRPSGTGSRPSGTGSRPSGTGSRPSGTGSRPSGTGSRLLIAHDGDLRSGLLVDRVVDILEIVPPQPLGRASRSTLAREGSKAVYVAGEAEYDGKVLVLLDLGEVFRRALEGEATV